MKLVENPKIGDYVIATAWKNHELRNPWHIGNIMKIIESGRGFTYKIYKSEVEWLYVYSVSDEENELLKKVFIIKEE